MTGVTALTLEIDDADDDWDEAAQINAKADTADKQEGDASLEVHIQNPFTTGLAAWEDLSSTLDLKDHSRVRLWLKPQADVAAGVFELLLDDSPGCATPMETLAIPALTAAEGWVQHALVPNDPDALTALACVGLNVTSDLGNFFINLDLIEAPAQVSHLNLMVAPSLSGGPVDFRTTTDTDSDGWLADEADQAHTLVISYLDKRQRAEDLAWTSAQIGRNDGDVLLEKFEKRHVTVDVSRLSLPIDGERLFRIELKPRTGSVMTFERRTPNTLDRNVDLR